MLEKMFNVFCILLCFYYYFLKSFFQRKEIYNVIYLCIIFFFIIKIKNVKHEIRVFFLENQFLLFFLLKQKIFHIFKK